MSGIAGPTGSKKKGAAATIAAPFPVIRDQTQFISDLLNTFTGLRLAGLFIGEDGVRVFSIAFDSVDLGVGNFAGPPCSVIGRTGVLVTITGLLLTLAFAVFWVAWASVLACPCPFAIFRRAAFFPNRTEAGRGLMFFTTGLATVFFVVFIFFTCATFAAGFTVFFSIFDGAIDNPITGTATKPTAATTAHFIQLFMTTPLPKPISKIRPAPEPSWELAHQVGLPAALHARPSRRLSGSAP
jgi:hypothetical protein